MADTLEPILRARESDLAVIDGERSVVAKVSTSGVDRFGTDVDPAGAKLDAYRNNPVGLWMHGMDIVRGNVPTFRCAWVRYSKPDKALLAKLIYHDDEFSEGIFRLRQEGFLKAYSVRGDGVPGKCSSPTPEEIRKRPELAECWLMYREWELQEISDVSVGGNKDALQMAVSRGLELPDTLRKSLELQLAAPVAPPAEQPPSTPELPTVGGRTFAEVHRALREKARGLPIREEIRRAGKDLMDLLQGKI